MSSQVDLYKRTQGYHSHLMLSSVLQSCARQLGRYPFAFETMRHSRVREKQHMCTSPPVLENSEVITIPDLKPVSRFV
jgi:hypothetical protein